MAQFYGRVKGSASERTAQGTKTSGMTTTAETWSYVVKVELSDRSGIEWAEVSIQTKEGQQVAKLYNGPLSAEFVNAWPDIPAKEGVK